ncbi:MAG: BON domain-containing protein [Gammaproteobacteria bacterium]|nr:BON domain-containing protein [Gammaproteobacteria bacterium]
MTSLRFPLLGAIVVLCATQLSGCTAVAIGAVGAAAATGGTVAHDRRTAGTFVDDELIEWKVADALKKDVEVGQQSHINVTSYNNIVLLTGEVPTESLRARAQDHASGVAKVRLVHNELAVAAPSSLLSRSSDSVITGKVKTILFTDQTLPASRVKVVTESGTVYLLGLVSRAESDWATQRVRTVSGVQRVVKLFEFQDS